MRTFRNALFVLAVLNALCGNLLVCCMCNVAATMIDANIEDTDDE
jgi:hypothetical protein